MWASNGQGRNAHGAKKRSEIVKNAEPGRGSIPVPNLPAKKKEEEGLAGRKISL